MSKSLGQIGEEIAANYLQRKKYKILERNYRKPWGELDIVAKKDNEVVFVEVKTITQSQEKSRFLPEEEITPQKKKRLIRAAKMYLWEKKYPPDQTWQIDVIGIEQIGKRKYRLRHTKKAISDYR